MVAPTRSYRRWFIINGTLSTGHPGAMQPMDGYYASESDAKRARKIMVQCYGIPAKQLAIACEDVSELSADETAD